VLIWLFTPVLIKDALGLVNIRILSKPIKVNVSIKLGIPEEIN
jgi:hypothetical protein